MQNCVNNGEGWYWLVDDSSGSFLLKLSEDVVFPTVYKASELINSFQDEQCFTTSDAFLYSLFRDKFSAVAMDEQQAFTLAVNATVANHYLKPQAIKSWFFAVAQHKEKKIIRQGDWVALNAKEQAIYLVLDTDQHASNVILVSERHVIDDSRLYIRGKALRVHNDRLTPVSHQLQDYQL